VGEALSEQAEQLHIIEQNWFKNCRGYVHDNPIVSLGISWRWLSFKPSVQQSLKH